MAGGATRVHAAPRDTTFDVFRKGAKIGTHNVEFRDQGSALKVTTQVELAVKVAFITAFSYDQTAVDLWQDGTLVRTWITTDDNGAETLVEAEARDGRLAVAGPAGRYDAPLGAMTDISFWNQGITRGPPLIDSQNGKLITVSVDPGTPERLEVRGRPVDTMRFTMAGTKDRSGTVWYSASGDLVRAVVLTRGETLTYELAA